MKTPSCPDRERLRAFADGSLVEPEAEAVAEHLDACASCDDTVSEFERRLETLFQGMRRRPAEERGDVLVAYHGEPELARAVQELCAAPQTPAPRTESLPRRLGQYQLLRALPGGGMGQVYQARHAKLGVLVAVKLLPHWRLADPLAIERFEQEMQAAGKLIHPHIVRALDAGEVDGVHYLAMDFVEGLDLSEVVRRTGPLPVADACEVIRQAALGLQHLHEHALVHRDIKPSNLMLAPDGTVKILDFGLALLRGAHDRSAPLTVTGHVMGTLDYMAPEQADDSHAVDIRADVYSLGATLYRLLTGRAPLEGCGSNTPFGRLQALAALEPPPVRELRPEVPRDLARVNTRLLAKKPAQRFATPHDVAVAVAPFASGADLPRLGQQALASGTARTDRTASVSQRESPGSGATPLPTNTSIAAREPICRPPRGKFPRSALLVFPIALVLFGLGLWFGPTLWLLAGNRGRLIIEVPEGEDIEAKLVIKHGEVQVEIIDLKTNRRTILRAQEYGLELVGGPPGLTLSAQQLSLRRGETEVVRVTLEDPPKNAAQLPPVRPTPAAAPAVAGWNVRFQPRVTYRVGESPRSVVANDLDGDGDPDLATGNAQTVSILLNRGDGTFQGLREFPVGDRTSGLAVGDFDGDGQPDLAAANGGSDDVAILINQAGRFAVHGRCTSGRDTYSAVVADFSRDGRSDLGAVAGDGGIVNVFLGGGDATFQPGQTCAVGTSPRGIAVADFDGDHVLDLSVCNIDSGFVSLLWGRGDGTFEPAQTVEIGAGTLDAAPGDFNGDGRLDLAVTGPDAVSVLLGQAERSFRRPVKIEIGGATEHQPLAAADLNRDGVLDLLSGMYHEHCLLLMLGRGDGTFRAPLSFPAGTLPIALTVADLNADGLPDVAVVNADTATVSVLLQQPAPTAPPSSQSTNLDVEPKKIQP
jgi:serine/threonine protein kinase